MWQAVSTASTWDAPCQNFTRTLFVQPGAVRDWTTVKSQRTVTNQSHDQHFENPIMPPVSSCQNTNKGLKPEVSVQMEVTLWAGQSEAALQDAPDCVDWEMLRSSLKDVNTITNVVVGLIGKLIDDMVQKTSIPKFPDQKSWVDKNVSDSLRAVKNAKRCRRKLDTTATTLL